MMDNIERQIMDQTLYDLSRLNILIVDDCEFARRTISNVLRVLKVGKLTLAKDGGEAIEEIKKSVESSAVVGQCSIDIIITDWLMDPINGAMLTRWVRRSGDSPDRFMPVVALSGAVEEVHISEARDIGVTEFIAKPFSISSVAKRLVSVIEQPRQFIFNGDYFGPDRRRKPMNIKGEDRRVISPNNIEVIYSGKKPESLDTEAKIWHFKLPNNLKGKFSTGNAVGTIDPGLLEAAEEHLQSMEDDYADWVADNIKEMLTHYEALKNEPVNPWRHLTELGRIAHQLRGQGGTFGYNLITIFGKSLVDCTSVKRDIDDNLLDFIKAHIDAVQAVLRDSIRGHGGPIGEELVKMLDKAREKYTSQQTAA